jgi:glycosyltransferase involved in cell wall biosynthesis
MKIVLINSLYPPQAVGGAERVVETLAKGLVARGDEVTVLTLNQAAAPEEDVRDGVRIVRLPLYNLYWPFGGAPRPYEKFVWHALDSYNVPAERQVSVVLSAEKPDLVHTHNLAGFSVLAWRAAKTLRLPLLHTLHDYYLLCPRSTAFRNGRNCTVPCRSCAGYSWTRKHQSRQVDGVVGVSQYILDRHVQAGVFPDRPLTRTILNALTHEPPPDIPVPMTSRGGKLTLGFIGRVEQVKGIEALLQAFSGLAGFECELLVAGEGVSAYVAELKARFPQPNIVFLGRIDPAQFYPRLDLLVVPSLWNEPLGMVAFEAFMHAVPVVASARGGLPEVVNERCGAVFDPDTKGDLLAVLRNLLTDRLRLKSLSLGALKESVQYRPQRQIDAYRDFYERILQLPLVRAEESSS